MSYKLKTLIVFDTNSLRKVRTNAKEREIIDYSNFEFGSPFKKIKDFLVDKKIIDLVHLALPEMVLSELQNQCAKQYQKEYKLIQETLNRISEIPHKSKISLLDPDINFNYSNYIIENINKAVEEQNVLRIPFDETKTSIMFKNMMEKVLDIEDVKSPFRPKDAGFKDNIIWESLIRFDGITNYDKVFFLTKDGDYKENCNEEFLELWPNQEIFFRKDSTQIILDIERMYRDYLAEKVIWDFADSDFFIESLKGALVDKSMILLNGKQYKIEEYTIENNCFEIERLIPDEDENENILMYSKVNFHLKSENESFILSSDSKTTLFDMESKEIVSHDFDIEFL